MNLRERGCEAVIWIQLVQDKVRWRDFVNKAMEEQSLTG
jgi:hypothetical protein